MVAAQRLCSARYGEGNLGMARSCFARRALWLGRLRLKSSDTLFQDQVQGIDSVAQTERRGDAGPVRVLLGGGHAPAAFL